LLEHPYHFNQKTDGKGEADEHDEACGKKGHDKVVGVFKGVGCPQQVNTKDQKKN
jgi:hypothetical protein